MIFEERSKPREIIHGTVQVIGARKVQVQVGKRSIVAKCDKKLMDSIAVGTTVILAYVGSDQTQSYVLSVTADPLDQNDQGVFTI